MSRTAFSKLFTRVVGETPSSYLRRGQIESAKRLLAETDLPMKGDHQEFIDPATGLSRVRTGVAFAADGGTGNQVCPLTGGRTDDLGWSHGTAVASILSGRTVGAAKAVTIVPIRIYACQQDQGPTATTERLNS